MALPKPRAHPQQPGQRPLAGGYGGDLAARWRQLTLWASVWRVAAGTLVAVVTGQALNHLIVWQWLGSGYFRPGLLTLVVSLLLPTLFYAALAAVLHRWLARFRPLAQVGLFGASAYVGVVLLWAVLLSPTLLSGVNPGIFAALGYGLALASVAPRGRWIAIAAAVLAMLLAAWAVVGTLVRAGSAG